MAILEYGIGGNEVKVDTSEAIANIPENRSLIVEQLTADEPVTPEAVKGLSTIEEVFAHFLPNIDVEFENEEGQPVKENFRFNIKQRGALLAKGRILGIQFFELFKDNLYFDLAKHANNMAILLRNEITSMGYKFLTHSPTNQIFPILPNEIIEKLQEKYLFYVWSKIDENNSSIRLVTSWATQEEFVLKFIEDLKSLTK